MTCEERRLAILLTSMAPAFDDPMNTHCGCGRVRRVGSGLAQARYLAHPCYTPAPKDLDHDDVALIELRQPAEVCVVRRGVCLCAAARLAACHLLRQTTCIAAVGARRSRSLGVASARAHA